jgi:hypothetical protein
LLRSKFAKGAGVSKMLPDFLRTRVLALAICFIQTSPAFTGPIQRDRCLIPQFDYLRWKVFLKSLLERKLHPHEYLAWKWAATTTQSLTS